MEDPKQQLLDPLEIEMEKIQKEILELDLALDKVRHQAELAKQVKDLIETIGAPVFDPTFMEALNTKLNAEEITIELYNATIELISDAVKTIENLAVNLITPKSNFEG